MSQDASEMSDLYIQKTFFREGSNAKLFKMQQLTAALDHELHSFSGQNSKFSKERKPDIYHPRSLVPCIRPIPVLYLSMVALIFLKLSTWYNTKTINNGAF